LWTSDWIVQLLRLGEMGKEAWDWCCARTYVVIGGGLERFLEGGLVKG